MQKTNEPRLRFTKVRDVKSPVRANPGDAGIDFYIPYRLPFYEMMEKNPTLRENNFAPNSITLGPHQRVIIPSGIRVLLEPRNSMLQVNNKSGISTRTGLVYTAQVVDSPYVGEIHLCVVNTSREPVKLMAGEKLVQLIHIPIFLTELEEIDPELYEEIAKTWGTRGANGFGSTDKVDINLDIMKCEGLTADDELNMRSY